MTATLHPALVKAPKTPREALTRMRDIINAELAKPGSQDLTKQHYHRMRNGRDCHCLLGKFFTPEQLADLRVRVKAPGGIPGAFLSTGIRHVAEHVGEKNVRAMFGGLDINTLDNIQMVFDKDDTAFYIRTRSHLTVKLALGGAELDVPFLP